MFCNKFLVRTTFADILLGGTAIRFDYGSTTLLHFRV